MARRTASFLSSSTAHLPSTPSSRVPILWRTGPQGHRGEDTSVPAAGRASHADPVVFLLGLGVEQAEEHTGGVMGGGVPGGGQPRPADRPMPHYRPAPEYPPLLDDLRVPGHPPAAS